MFAVKFLEGVVGENNTVDLVGHLQNKRVSPTDRTRRRRNDFSGQHSLFELILFRIVDPMSERGVDDDGERLVRVLARYGAHSFIELGEARQTPTLGCNVGSIDD